MSNIEFLTPKQVEQMYGLNPLQQFRARSNGMPHYKIEVKTIRYKKTELDHWFKSKKVII